MRSPPTSRGLGALAILVALTACGGQRPPPSGVVRDDVIVNYYVRVARPGIDRYEVTMAVDRMRRDSVDFVLPSWMPGRYGLGPGRPVIENFVARDGRGQPVPIRRLGLTRWRLYAEGADYLTLAYLVVPGSSSEPLAYRTRLELHSGYALGGGLLGWLDGFQGRPVTVAFDLPPGWRVVAPLRPAGPNRFSGASYAALPGAPIVLGDRMRDYKLFVQGRPHQVTVQGAARDFAPDSLLRLVDETIAYGTRFLGPPPYERYVFAIHFEPPDAWAFGAIGQADGAAFFLPVIDPDRLREAGIGPVLLHQYVHAWFPGRFGPAELVRPRFDVPPSLEGFWFVEGAAEYYAHLLPSRYGNRGRSTFYDAMGRLLTEWRDVGGGNRLDPEALTRAARSDSDERSLRRLIAGGALAAFLVDLTIRDGTRGLLGLDQAIHYLQRRSPSEGYRWEVVWNEMAVALGVPATALGPLTGEGELSIEAGLSRAGLRAVARRDTDRLGARLQPGPGGAFVVTDVTPGGTAASAGLRQGDRLVKIGPTAVGPDEVVATRFALSRFVWDARPGTPVTFEIERDGEVRQQRGVVREARVVRVSIVEDPDATPTEMLVRGSLFEPAQPPPGD